MIFEVICKLDDDETADHEARRLLCEIRNKAANFFPEPDKGKSLPIAIFSDPKSVLTEANLLAAADCLREASLRATSSSQRHLVEYTLAVEKKIEGEALEAIRTRVDAMSVSCQRTAQELRDLRELVWKWYRDLHAQGRARTVGDAAMAAMARPWL